MSAMDLALYDSVDGGIVLVPVPLLPPREAIRLHGPLVARGRLRVPDTRIAPWPEIAMQLDRHLFAALGAPEAGVLLEAHEVVRPGG